jgi:hypothetical protein
MNTIAHCERLPRKRCFTKKDNIFNPGFYTIALMEISRFFLPLFDRYDIVSDSDLKMA